MRDDAIVVMLRHAILPSVPDSKSPHRRATYEDVLRAPAHMVAEILDGELHLSPRPAPRHARAKSRLGVFLGGFNPGFGGPGGWEILAEPELHLELDVVVPDWAGWRQERLPELPETAFFTVAPDWVCEILSPSTAKIDHGTKLRIYARERVAHAWLLDLIARRLEVLTLTGSEWATHAIHTGDERVRAVPFDAVEIDLPLLWGTTPFKTEP